jgi:hypothetical protein
MIIYKVNENIKKNYLNREREKKKKNENKNIFILNYKNIFSIIMRI